MPCECGSRLGAGWEPVGSQHLAAHLAKDPEAAPRPHGETEGRRYVLVCIPVGESSSQENQREPCRHRLGLTRWTWLRNK